MIFNKDTTVADLCNLASQAKPTRYLISLSDNPVQLQLSAELTYIIVGLGDEVKWNGTDFVIVQKNYYKGPIGEAFQPYKLITADWPGWARGMWNALPFDPYSICSHRGKYFIRFESEHREIGETDWLVRTSRNEYKLLKVQSFREWRNQ